MEEKLLTRKEVSEDLKWDLHLIYKNDEEMQADVDKFVALTEETVTKYKGHLNIAQNIVDCLLNYGEISKLMSWTGHYTYLAVEVDYYDNESAEKSARVDQITSECEAKLSFIQSEIVLQSDEVLTEAMNLCDDTKHYIKNVIDSKKHMLHPEVERVLTAISETTGAPYKFYCTTKLADMKFDDFEANGKKYPLGYSLFEESYEYNIDTEIRRNAFNAFSKKIKEYENSTACAYNIYVQHEKKMANLRGYPSIFEKDLDYDKVNLELYNRQIDLITEKLAPHMRKYAKLLQRIHKLDKMTFADLHLPVDHDYCPEISIEESKKYVIGGLSVFGDDYVKMINEAYDNHWVDFAKNTGKCTGGFCASPYKKNSFILMTWNNNMADVFTLAHELGHAGHFRLCSEAQSIFDTNVSSYFVEAPSTMNEILMTHYMLKTNTDKRFRRWVLSNMVSDTYYHNFVTHLLEAAYQREVYKIVDAGGSVQAEKLSEIYRNILEKFWGDTVEINPGAELTWMRQPHYYMGLYSYTYSAGLTVATEVCKRIEKEGACAVEDWKKVLCAGSTLAPVELAKLAGVDISTDAALLDTIDTIGAYIDEIISLTDELE